MRSLILAVFLFFVVEDFCVAQTKPQILQKAYQLASSTKGPYSAKYQRQFFDAFPSSFKTLNDIYGWNHISEKPAPLSEVSLEHINYFFKLQGVPKESLTKKIIKIAVNGEWDADGINFFLGNLHKYAVGESKSFFKILKDFEVNDIISLWSFYFDFENSESRKKYYEQILKLVGKDSDMVVLVTKGYREGIKRNPPH